MINVIMWDKVFENQFSNGNKYFKGIVELQLDGNKIMNFDATLLQNKDGEWYVKLPTDKFKNKDNKEWPAFWLEQSIKEEITKTFKLKAGVSNSSREDIYQNNSQQEKMMEHPPSFGDTTRENYEDISLDEIKF